MPAHAADCERITDAFLSQPVNALSSLLFVAAGAVVLIFVRRASGRRPRLGAGFALALVFVGLGSVMFHGPAGRWADWAHDGSTATLLLLVIGVELGDRAAWTTPGILRSWLIATLAALTMMAIWPAIGDSFNAPLALAAVVGAAAPLGGPTRRKASGQKLLALAVVAAGGVVLFLSRTGRPLCDPDALLQGHAIWHLLAATGLSLYMAAVCTHPPFRSPAAPST